MLHLNTWNTLLWSKKILSILMRTRYKPSFFSFSYSSFSVSFIDVQLGQPVEGCWMRLPNWSHIDTIKSRLEKQDIPWNVLLKTANRKYLVLWNVKNVYFILKSQWIRDTRGIRPSTYGYRIYSFKWWLIRKEFCWKLRMMRSRRVQVTCRKTM